MRRAVRSEPAQGSVRAKRRELLAAGQFGQIALFLLGVAESSQRIDGADAAVNRREPGHVGLDRRHSHQEPRKRGERGTDAAVLRVDQEPPVAGGAQIVEDRLRRPCCRARTSVPCARWRRDGLERLLHRPLAGRRDRRLLGQEKLDGELAVPDGAMDGAVGGLVARGEEGVDLIVGSIDRAGRPRFFLALAAHLERGLDERLRSGSSTGYPWEPRRSRQRGVRFHSDDSASSCDRSPAPAGPSVEWVRTSCASSQSSRMIWFRNGARNSTAFAGSFRVSQLLRLMLGITLLPRRSRCLIFSCFMIRLLNRSKPVGNNFGSGPT